MTANNDSTLDNGQITVAPGHLSQLRASGLDTFEKIMACPAKEMMRSVPGRSTVRVQLKSTDGSPRFGFLKRYEPSYLSAWKRLLRFLHLPSAADEAMHEWKMICALRERGFHTPDPIAVGQQRRGGIVLRSFLITAEITGGVAGHEYVRTITATHRRALAVALADLTRKFHDAGFIYKDYYLNHIFVVERGGQTRFVFVDLQRVAGPKRFHRRWHVKDLGTLGYSAQLAGVTRTDLMRFYRRCFNKQRLNAADKQFIRKIAGRINALHARGPKYDAIWDQPGVRPRNV